MNAQFLAVTRAALGIATGITAAIIRFAPTITAAAAEIHRWSLNATIALAERNTEKAHLRLVSADRAVATAKHYARIETVMCNAVASRNDNTILAACHELSTLPA